MRRMAEEWENDEEGESLVARLRIKEQNAEEASFDQAEEQVVHAPDSPKISGGAEVSIETDDIISHLLRIPENSGKYVRSEESVVEIFHDPDDIKVEATSNGTRERSDKLEQIAAVNEGQLSADTDLERILKEQETHDLYCPNCHSCITKRVILRKRKRITTREAISDENPAEDSGAQVDSDEVENRDGDRSSEPQVFRCLSCFSYFIPTGSGFRLFKKFGRREEDDDVRGQGCLFSLYDLMTGRRNKRELGIHPSTENRDEEASPLIISDNLEEETKKKQQQLAGEGRVEREVNPISHIQLPPPGDEIIYVPEEAAEVAESCSFSAGPWSRELGRPVHGEETRIPVLREERREEEEAREVPRWDVLKAIVYGGLLESVVGLGVISAAAGSSVRTATVVAMGLGALAGGLPALIHNLTELRNEQSESRYEQLLGDKSHFWLQAVVAVICFVLVGVSQPLIYGFSFRTSGLREQKLAAVAGASLAWVILLAAAKAHSQEHPRKKTYLLTILHYLALAASASGISFFVGATILRLLPVFNDQANPNASPLTNGIALL